MLFSSCYHWPKRNWQRMTGSSMLQVLDIRSSRSLVILMGQHIPPVLQLAWRKLRRCLPAVHNFTKLSLKCLTDSTTPSVPNIYNLEWRCVYIYIYNLTRFKDQHKMAWLLGLTTHRVNITGKSINSRFIDSHSHYFTVLQLNNTQKLLYEI